MAAGAFHACLWGGAGRLAESAEPRPAPPARVVVLIVLDAARARSFSCYGYARETTPRIDGLARGGLCRPLRLEAA